jgi:ethanolamine phosphate phosphodiesterase
MSYYKTGFPRRSTRNHFVDPPSLTDRFFAALPDGLAALLQGILVRVRHAIANSDMLRIPRNWQEAQYRFSPRALLNLPNAFVLIWIFVLLWGERWVFDWSINGCQWEKWERWVSMAFSSNPQVDFMSTANTRER